MCQKVFRTKTDTNLFKDPWNQIRSYKIWENLGYMIFGVFLGTLGGVGTLSAKFCKFVTIQLPSRITLTYLMIIIPPLRRNR